MSRPTISPDFATDSVYVAAGKAWDGAATKVAPGGIKTEGWEPEFVLAAQHMNYMIGNHGEWLNWLETRRSIRAMWTSTCPTAGTGGDIGDWHVYYPAASTPTQNNASATYAAPSVTLTAPVVADYSEVTTLYGFTTWTADFSGCMTADLSMSASGANNQTIAIGLCGSTPTIANFHGAKFSKTSAQTNWQCITNDGAASTTTDSGVPPVANTIQKFKILMQGASVTGGAKALFYINGTLVATHTTNIESSTTALSPCVIILCTVNNANSITVGTVTMAMQS